ncbi:MFS transporter [Saccharopolyspora sp. K220]|uniref:MFS transporter n=1 Tax=Saccharopolyspora soli TaxID=2926618 RepID=UPI001F5ADFD3|nr:MFS transporter [Saccharopolyspora soli]MCI2416898.1 MFS transporter [Saccharopolyspora soli]
MTTSKPASLWSIGPWVFLPTLLFGIGQGAIAPAVALSARDLGASVATASLVVAASGLGLVVGDIPAGALTARIGERKAMLLASVVASAALVACLAAPAVWALALAIATTGLASAVFALARQAYLSDFVPLQLRARALSTLGGCLRIGMFVGPFLGAAAMKALGTNGAYWVHLVALLLAAVVLVRLPDPVQLPPSGPGTARASAPPTTLGVIRDHLPILRTLGTGALLVGAVRASRQVAIPLWAQHVGLDPATTSLVFGLSGAVETLLFYPAGFVMDRFGRKWVAVPSMLVLGTAHLVLPLTHDIVTLAGVAMLMGVGNGLGSGIIMTLGADASPPVGRAQFLGAFRLCADLGNGAGPFLIAAVTTLGGLAPAILMMGALGFAGAAALNRWIPRPPPSRS